MNHMEIGRVCPFGMVQTSVPRTGSSWSNGQDDDSSTSVAGGGLVPRIHCRSRRLTSVLGRPSATQGLLTSQCTNPISDAPRVACPAAGTSALRWALVEAAQWRVVG
jgi:hypothetical protein